MCIINELINHPYIPFEKREEKNLELLPGNYAASP